MSRTLVVVVGVPGSGKTTILKKLKEILPEVEVLNFGDFMMEEVLSHYGALSRDEMRVKIDLDSYRKIQLKAAERIASCDKDLVVLDTHVAIKTPNGYYPGLPKDVLNLLKVDMVVVLEFPPEDILSRRGKDKANSRVREIEKLAEIDEHQTLNRMFATAVVNEAACYLKILKFYEKQTYPYQHAEQAANEIARLIKELQAQKNFS